MKPEDEKFLDKLNGEDRTFHEELIREELVHLVNNEITLYRQTGDARFFWKAIMLLHEHREPVPEQYMAQIVKWAGKVQSISEPREIAAALELSGDAKRKVGPKHSAAYEKTWRLASEVKNVKNLRAGTSLAKAIGIVARNKGLPLPVVKAAYHEVFTAPVTKQSRKAPRQNLADAMRGWHQK